MGPFNASEDARAPWVVIGYLGGLLERLVGSDLHLERVSLTAPPGVDVREHVPAFARLVGAKPAEGVLMAIDRRGDGTEHLYGIALVGARTDVQGEWCRLTGARESSKAIKIITGWKQHAAGRPGDLLENVAAVIGYAFKAWPAEHGRRCLRRDVFAWGVLAPVWASALAALGGRGEVSAAEVYGRRCERCGAPLGPGKRAHAKWCSANCRIAASKERRERSKAG